MLKLAEVKKANRDAHEAAERLIANAEDERQRTDAVSQQVFMLSPTVHPCGSEFLRGHNENQDPKNPRKLTGRVFRSCKTCSTKRFI
jgi:hypothetical protein